MRSVSKPVPTSLISGVILISAASAGFAFLVYQTLSVHQGNTGVSYLEYIAENSYPCEIPQTPGNLSRCGQSQESEAISENFCRDGVCIMLIGDQVMYADRCCLDVNGSNYVFNKLADVNPEFFDRVRSVGVASSG